MLQEVEKLYASHFGKCPSQSHCINPNACLVNGDSKKARIHLRNIAAPSNHHFSVFRSGVLIGLSIPALVIGAYHGKSIPVMGFE